MFREEKHAPRGLRKRRRSSFSQGRRQKARLRPGRLQALGELKFLDTVKVATAIGTTGTALSTTLLVIPQGNGESERQGRKVTIRSIQFRGKVNFPSTSTILDMDQRVRILVYVDSQTNKLAAPLADIVNTAGTVDIDAFRDLSNTSRFKVLMDRIVNLPVHAVRQSSATVGANVPQLHSWQFFKKLNVPIEYDSSADDGTLATITSNNIGIFAISHTATEAPLVGYTCRVRYTDM